MDTEKFILDSVLNLKEKDRVVFIREFGETWVLSYDAETKTEVGMSLDGKKHYIKAKYEAMKLRLHVMSDEELKQFQSIENYIKESGL